MSSPRRVVVVGMVAAGVAMGSIAILPPMRAATEGEARSVRSLELYYTPPVVVRAGERVRIPVHVVCSTEGGRPCRAAVAMDAREHGGPWVHAEASSGPEVTFDVTGPAARAGRGGRVDVFMEARGPGGARTAVPAERGGRPIPFYVAPDLPVVPVPAVPFGEVRTGRVVLDLPWGTGPNRVGIRPGLESSTAGPSSFDVGTDGEIHLADVVGGRVAVFVRGRLAGETRLPLGRQATVAVGPSGTTYVADAVRGEPRVRRIEGGRVRSSRSLPPGLPAETRVSASGVWVHMLPLDTWLPVTTSSPPSSDVQVVGQPVASERQLLSRATESSVRLAFTDGDRVWDAVELRGPERFGELALAEPTRDGGIAVVVHVWRYAPTPADQYQVIVVRGGHIVSTFAVANRSFSDIAPFGRFRLGPDGHLYQLTTSPSGTRIVRYGLEEGSR